jgi:hypothetical protein
MTTKGDDYATKSNTLIKKRAIIQVQGSLPMEEVHRIQNFACNFEFGMVEGEYFPIPTLVDEVVNL